MATPKIELPRLQEGTISDLVKELELKDYTMPEGFSEKDILKLSKEEKDRLVNELHLLPIEEQKQHFSEFLKNRSETIKKGEEAVDKLKDSITKAAKSIPQVGAPLAGAEIVSKLKPIQETLSAVKEGVQELLTPLFTLLSSIPLIGGIFKWLGELFGLNLGDNLKGKAEKTAEKVKNTIPKEKAEEIKKEVSKKFSQTLRDNYGLNLNEKLADGKTKAQKVEEIIQEKLNGNLEKFYNKDTNEVNVTVNNVLGLFSTGPGILYDLIKSGVIGVESLTFNITTAATGYVKYIAKSISGKDLGDFGLSGEIALDKINNNLSESERLFLLAIFQRKGGFITELIGKASWAITSCATGLMQLGLDSTLKTDIIGKSKSLVPGVEGKIKTMEEILARYSKLNPGPEEKELLKKLIEESKKNLEALKTVQNYHSGKVNIDTARNIIEGVGSQSGTLDWIKRQSMKVTGFDAWNKNFLANDYIQQSTKYRELLKSSLDLNKLRPIAKLKSYFQFMEIPGSANKAVMYFENESALNKFATLLSQTPEASKAFFGHSISIIVGGMAIKESMESKNTIGAIGTLAKYFVPIVGPIMMMGDAGVKINFSTLPPQVTYENTSDLVMGTMLLTIDGYFFSKAVISSVAKRSTMPLFEAIAKPILDPLKAIRALNRFSGTIVKSMVGIGTNAIKTKKLQLVIAGLGLLAVGTAAAAYEMNSKDSPEEVERRLKKEGLMTPEGSMNLTKVKSEFNKLSKNKRKEILDVMYCFAISHSYKNEENIPNNTDFDGKAYIITTKNENEKNYLEKALADSTLKDDLGFIGGIQVKTKANS